MVDLIGNLLNNIVNARGMSTCKSSQYNLENVFKSHAFTEYDKIKPDIVSGKLNVSYLLRLTEIGLMNLLQDDYGIDLIQAGRAVDAIKEFPESRMNHQSPSRK